MIVAALLLPLSVLAAGALSADGPSEVSPQLAAQLFGGSCDGQNAYPLGKCGTSSAKGCVATDSDNMAGDGDYVVTSTPICGTNSGCGTANVSEDCDDL
jgi:hypothetical protein